MDHFAISRIKARRTATAALAPAYFPPKKGLRTNLQGCIDEVILGNDSIIWSEGIKQMDLVIKDNSGGSGHAHKRKDHEKFFPTKVRITMVQVSAGSTYDPSLVPNLPPAPKASDPESKDAKTPADTKAVSASNTSTALPATKPDGGCCGCE